MHRKKTQKLRKQRGGAYVGKGVYGCTFRPALRCAGEAERRPDKFAKLLPKYSANDELAARRLLQPLDPKHRYFIYPDGICRPAPLAPSDEIDKCPHDFSNLDEARILIQADGGTKIPDIELQAADFIPFFRSLRGLIEGLEIIHAEGIAHNDIKPDNIVSKRFLNGKFLTRYVDLGLVVNASTLDDEVENEDNPFYNFNVFHTNYMFWAFDVRLAVPSIMHIAQRRGASVSTHISNFYAVLPTSATSYPARALRSPQLNIANVGIMADYYSRMSPAVRYAAIFTGSDIHGLGITLAQIYEQFVGHRDYGYDHPQIIICDYPTWRPVEDPMTRYSAEEIEWHRSVARDISMPFYRMIRKMITTEPTERYTTVAALSVYIELLPAIERLFTADAVHINIKPFGTPHHVRANTPPMRVVQLRETQETPRLPPHSPLVAESNVFKLTESGTVPILHTISPGWATVGYNGKSKKGGRRTIKRGRR